MCSEGGAEAYAEACAELGRINNRVLQLFFFTLNALSLGEQDPLELSCLKANYNKGY